MNLQIDTVGVPFVATGSPVLKIQRLLGEKIGRAHHQLLNKDFLLLLKKVEAGRRDLPSFQQELPTDMDNGFVESQHYSRCFQDYSTLAFQLAWINNFDAVL